MVSWHPAGQHGVDDGGDGRGLTGDNAVIIAAAGAHFGTVGGAKQHKYCELRGPSQPATCSRATQGVIPGGDPRGEARGLIKAHSIFYLRIQSVLNN